MNKRTTIKDVAKRAGVSVATVSNVFNGIQKVSETTRERILEIAKEMDYQPNMVARSLSMQRSGMIGLLLPVTEEEEETSILLQDNPYYAEFLSGVEKKAAELGYDVIIRGVRPYESCREWILKRQLEGAIFVGNASDAVSDDSMELGNRLVLLDTYDKGILRHDHIGIDDKLGGRIATEYLLEKGHRGIVFAGSQIQYEGCIRERYLGYEETLEERNLFREKFVFRDELNFEGGVRIGKKMLEMQDEVTAVFAASDTVAFGIMNAYEQAGKNLPDELSVVGFDDTKTCEYVYPKLTSINQNSFLKGVKAVEILHNAGEDKEKEPVELQLPVVLVERDSVRER